MSASFPPLFSFFLPHGGCSMILTSALFFGRGVRSLSLGSAHCDREGVVLLFPSTLPVWLTERDFYIYTDIVTCRRAPYPPPANDAVDSSHHSSTLLADSYHLTSSHLGRTPCAATLSSTTSSLSERISIEALPLSHSLLAAASSRTSLGI